MNTDKIGHLLMQGADEIDYGALDDELLGALALQTDEPFIATSALGEMAQRIPARGRDIAEAILQRAPWDDYLTAYAVEILFARDPEAARREMSRLVQTSLHPTVLESMVENVMSDRERFQDAAGKQFVAQLAAMLAAAKATSFKNPEITGAFLQRYAPGALPGTFILLGNDGDESRLLVHGASGFSMAVPGRPWLESDELGPPKFDAVIRMRDLKVVLGVRLDTLPSAVDLKALASTLALTYAKQRAVEIPHVSPLAGNLIAVGADAAATCMYVIGDERPPQMEYLSVTLRKHESGVWALYQSVRYSLNDLTVIHWAAIRSVLQNFQTWDGRSPALPRIWPQSAYVKPGIELDLSDVAWEEARAKAREIGVLSQRQEDGLMEVLIQFAGDDHPPGFELHPVMVQVVRDRIAGAGLPETTQVLLRNSDGVKTMHDLRGWAWQCAWAISKRASKVAADESREQTIGRLMRDLAARLNREAAPSGPFEPIQQSLPAGDAARVMLAAVADADGTRELVVSVERPDRGAVTETLARGTNRELVLFLEAPMAARLALDAITLLERSDPAADAARRQFEQQTIDLARQMRDAIDRYDDPEVVAQREAYEREKAERIGARLASFYVKSGQRDGDEPLDAAIAKMLRYFAHRVDAEVPEVGTAPTVDQPLPTLDSGALVWLDLVSASSARELVLRIKSPDGKTTKSDLLLRGTKLRIITYLESPSRPSDLIAAIDELSASGPAPA